MSATLYLCTWVVRHRVNDSLLFTALIRGRQRKTPGVLENSEEMVDEGFHGDAFVFMIFQPHYTSWNESCSNHSCPVAHNETDFIPAWLFSISSLFYLLSFLFFWYSLLKTWALVWLFGWLQGNIGTVGPLCHFTIAGVESFPGHVCVWLAERRIRTHVSFIFSPHFLVIVLQPESQTIINELNAP